MGRYPWAEFILLEVLYNAILYPTRQHAFRVAALAAMVCLSVRIYLTPEATDPVTLTYTVGFAIAFHFVSMAHLLFSEGPFPDHWRRVRDEVSAEADPSGLDKLPSNFPLTKKLWWMVDIAYSARMVGWVQEPRNGIPPRPTASRRTFLWKTLFKLAINAVIIDLSASVLAMSPAFDDRVHEPTDGPETYLAAVSFSHRVPYVLSYGIRMGTVVEIMHNVMALLCVGLGYSSPTLWPDIWGRWGDAYTVRRFWGQTWHQRMRPMVAGIGKLVANKLLRFPRGSNRSSYTQLYVAFFLSGLIHSSGDFMLEKRVLSCSFKFFLLQAVAITFEDFIVYMAKRLLRRGGIELIPGRADESWVEVTVRVIGYCWVTLWFCLALPIWLDELDALGFSRADRGAIAQFLLDLWKQRSSGFDTYIRTFIP